LKNNASYTVLNARVSPPPEFAFICGDEDKTANSKKSVVEIPPGGDTVVDENPTTTLSNESLRD